MGQSRDWETSLEAVRAEDSGSWTRPAVGPEKGWEAEARIQFPNVTKTVKTSVSGDK